MDLGLHQQQIFAIFAVVLTAACIAAIYDHWKRANGKLQRQAIGVEACDEAQNPAAHGSNVTPRTAEASTTNSRRTMVADNASAANADPVNAPPHSIDSGTTGSGGGSVVELPREEGVPDPYSGQATTSVMTTEPRATAPGTSVATTIDPTDHFHRSTNSQSSESTGSERGFAVDQAQTGPVIVTLCEELTLNGRESPREFSAKPHRITVSAPLSASARVKNWEALLARVRPQNQDEPPAPNWVVEVCEDLLEAIAGGDSIQPGSKRPTEASLDELPAGFHDEIVLSRSIQARTTVRGLVVVIGVSPGTALEAAEDHAGTRESIRSLIQSLLGAHDFGCQTGADDFLLIFPGESGPSAQRKLSTISQSLWDFHLRALGEASVLFSWGGLEVRNELIGEAIASATERMRETQRSRHDYHRERALSNAV